MSMNTEVLFHGLFSRLCGEAGVKKAEVITDMFLCLNGSSAITDITAKVALYSQRETVGFQMVFGDSTDPSHPRCSKTMDPDKTLGGSRVQGGTASHSHQYGHQRAAQRKDINKATGGSKDQRHPHSMGREHQDKPRLQ